MTALVPCRREYLHNMNYIRLRNPSIHSAPQILTYAPHGPLPITNPSEDPPTPKSGCRCVLHVPGAAPAVAIKEHEPKKKYAEQPPVVWQATQQSYTLVMGISMNV
jgi:hypothetical protein